MAAQLDNITDRVVERADEVGWRESEMRKVAELAIEQLRADKDAWVGFAEDAQGTLALITTCDVDGPYILARPVNEQGYKSLEVVVRANGYRHARLLEPAQVDLRAKWTSVQQATRDVWDLLEA